MEELKISKEAVLKASKVSETSKEVLKTLFPEVFIDKHIPVGTLFISDKHGSKYILAQVKHSMYTLINLFDGNRYRDPIKLNNIDFIKGIPYPEMAKLCPLTEFTILKEKLWNIN